MSSLTHQHIAERLNASSLRREFWRAHGKAILTIALLFAAMVWASSAVPATGSPILPIDQDQAAPVLRPILGRHLKHAQVVWIPGKHGRIVLWRRKVHEEWK